MEQAALPGKIAVSKQKTLASLAAAANAEPSAAMLIQ
jgi:hypothetical protein